MRTYVARLSNHINEDIKRNWSSWNFGQEGFTGTKSELDAFLASATDDKSVWISGFDMYADDVKNSEFGELYPNYWVAIDNVNALSGLSCLSIDAEDEESAISEALSLEGQYWGDGDSFDANEAKLVYSNNEKGIHVFEL